MEELVEQEKLEAEYYTYVNEREDENECTEEIDEEDDNIVYEDENHFSDNALDYIDKDQKLNYFLNSNLMYNTKNNLEDAYNSSNSNVENNYKYLDNFQTNSYHTVNERANEGNINHVQEKNIENKEESCLNNNNNDNYTTEFQEIKEKTKNSNNSNNCTEENIEENLEAEDDDGLGNDNEIYQSTN